MASEREYTGRVRALRILRTIVESPYVYTVKRLAEIYEVDESQIKRDFEAFRTAHFELDRDERHRYALIADKPYEHLKALLVFTPKEEEILTEALQKLGATDKAVQKLQNKLSRVYDISKMHNTFDKNFLSKMDKLQKAQSEKKVIVLKDYPSTNSNTVQDRIVEAFHISAEDDIVHAFDIEKKGIRHFRISRITKLDITPQSWTFEGHHNIVATDPFRIQNNNQVKVHIRLKVGAKNELLERFPLSRSYIKESEEGIYDFECKVNSQYFGLTNFILGYHNDIIEIFEPESLSEHIKKEAQKMLEKL